MVKLTSEISLPRPGRRSWWLVVPGLISLVVVLSLGIALITWGIHALTGLQKEVTASLVTASGTILGATGVVVLNRRSERQRDLWLALRDKKVPIYEEFTEKMMALIFSSQTGGMKPAEAGDFFRTWTPKLMAWGSDTVVAEWSSYRRKHSAPKPGDLAPVWDLEDFLLVLRKDLGHANQGLGRGSLLALFVTDIDQLPPPSAR
jgi:hypothetical protein